MITHTVPRADYLAWAKVRAGNLVDDPAKALAQFVADLSLHNQWNKEVRTIGCSGIECIVRNQDFSAWLDSIKA
jgi:hypothetical protein